MVLYDEVVMLGFFISKLKGVPMHLCFNVPEVSHEQRPAEVRTDLGST
jgi:hypothetical protein